MRLARLCAAIAIAAAGSLDAQSEAGIFAPGSRWELLGSGYQLTADSTADNAGNVYFTDARRNRIWRIDLDGKISEWKSGSNGSHGIAFGPDGRLYVGQHDRKRIVAFTLDGAESVVAEGMQTHHLKVTARNFIFFAEAPLHKIWVADPARRIRVASGELDWPRGLAASSDGTVLAANDAHSNWVWRFRIQPDGALAEGARFCRLETGAGTETDPGGMTFDSEGRLYVATKQGIQVCDPSGRVAATIPIPSDDGAANVWFAGDGLRWLYVTNGDRLYRRLSNRRGSALAAPARQ